MSMRLYAKEENGLTPYEVMQREDISNPNLLINGDFQVWQRGAYFEFVPSVIYTADRWFGIGNLICDVSRHEYGMYRCARTSGYFMGISQYMEMSQQYARRLLGQPVTLSYCLRTSAPARTFQGTNFPPYTDFVETVTFTFTQSEYDFVTVNGCSKCILDRIGVIALADGSPLPVGFWCIFEWVKLELGTVATPFSPRPYAEELAMCQRYYYVVSGMWNAAAWNTGYAWFPVQFPVKMRVIPSFALQLNPAYFYPSSGAYTTPQLVDLTGYTSNDVAVMGFNANPSYPFVTGNSYLVCGAFAFDAEIY